MLDEPNDLDVDALDKLGQCLIQAILDGETLDRIKVLIDTGAPVWYQAEDDGMSSLHAAAYSERKDLVDLLITEGAVWNAGV
jgi:type IV protein arginine methyltransferase